MPGDGSRLRTVGKQPLGAQGLARWMTHRMGAAFSAAPRGCVGILTDSEEGVNDPGHVPASPLTRGEGSFTPSSLLQGRRSTRAAGSWRETWAGYEIQPCPGCGLRTGPRCAVEMSRAMRRTSGHHVEQDGAVLGAVNASALRAARADQERTRLRALTAPPRSAALALT